MRDGIEWAYYRHAVLGDGNVRLCAYKASLELWELTAGGEVRQVSLDPYVTGPHPDRDAEPRAWRGEHGGHRFAAVHDHATRTLDLELVEPDGTRWTARSGFHYGPDSYGGPTPVPVGEWPAAGEIPGLPANGLDAEIRAHVGRLCQAPDERTPIDRLALVEAYYKATQVIGVVLDLHGSVVAKRWEPGCDVHPPEADADWDAMKACPACAGTEHLACKHCDEIRWEADDVWPCPTVLAIAAKLGIDAG